jgi:GTP-binding protein
MADIPGLIAGAHEGKGLGIRFLRHVERTRLLLHMIDVAEQSCRDPLEDYGVILNELQSFSPVVAAKPTLLVASRIDAVGEGDRLIRLREFCGGRGLPLHEISSVTGEGLEELKEAIWTRLEQIPKSDDRSGESSSHLGME